MKKFCIFALVLIMLLSASVPALAVGSYSAAASPDAAFSPFGLLLTGSAASAGSTGLTVVIKILLALVSIVLAALLICAAALTVLRIMNTEKHMSKSKKHSEKPSVLYIIRRDRTTWVLIAVVFVSLLLFILATSRCGKVGSDKVPENGSGTADTSDSSVTGNESPDSDISQIPGSGITGISSIIQPGMTTAEKIIAIFAVQNNLSMDDYPESLVDLLDRNPETRDFVLSYPLEHDQTHQVDLSDCVNTGSVPLLMQWDKRWGYIIYGDDVAALNACGPVCLSMAALYVTGDATLSPDRIIEFAKDNDYCVYGNGSSWTLISEGGAKLGLNVTELPLVEGMITDKLKAGIPIICAMGPGDFTSIGHFIVMTGYEDGKIKVNDPNSYERSAKLWDYNDIYDQILNLWAIE